MIRVIGTVFAGLLGLAFGSFLNVCLSRWPEGESVVTPRSHCRGCGRTLSWWENAPLVSWVALRGRCGSCGAWIGWRYVVVEAAVGGLWGFLVWRRVPNVVGSISFSPAALLASLGLAVLCFLLVGLAVLDAEHLWLPDAVTLPGIGVGVVYQMSLLWLSTGQIAVRPRLWQTIAEYIGGIFAAAGIILLIRWVYWLVRRREGIGLGDAKLMAMLGAWLGFPGALLSFVIGVVLGALVGVVVLVRGRRDGERVGLTKLPLGTFLCVGGIVSALWGSRIITGYLRWAGF